MSIRTLFALLLATLALAACGGEDPQADSSGSGGSSDPVDTGPRGAVKLADTFIETLSIDKTQPGWKTKVTKPPKFEFDAGDTYYWVLKTNHGTMRFKLLPDVAPMHVSSTIYLTRLGFYDDVVFHRVIRNFMAQGGDPLGKGNGGPAYKYGGEFSPDVRHDKAGLLSMANAGPGTDGSQFFITFRATEHLNDKHTIFGEIAEGEDVVKTLNGLAPAGGSRPSQPIVIEKATIEVE